MRERHLVELRLVRAARRAEVRPGKSSPTKNSPPIGGLGGYGGAGSPLVSRGGLAGGGGAGGPGGGRSGGGGRGRPARGRKQSYQDDRGQAGERRRHVGEH